MLQRFTISNFKSIADATLELSAFTVIVGANASGKSNLIEGIALMAWLGRGNLLTNLQTTLDSGEIPVRGTIQDFAREPDLPVSLGCSVAGPPGGTGTEVSVQVDLKFGPRRVAVVGETLTDNGVHLKPLYQVVEPAPEGSHDLRMEYNSFGRGSNPSITCLDDRAVFTQLDSPARFREKHKRAIDIIPARARRLRESLSQVLLLDPIPGRMRDYVHVIDTTLKPNGGNLSAVLHDLVENLGLKSEVLEFVRALPEQQIVDIRFIETPRNEVMVQLIESFESTTRPCVGALLSDGTLRVLAVAAALLSVPEDSVVVVEEIDNGVHPARVEMLATRIREVAARRRLRVVVTSHNATLLDSIPPEGLRDVVICHRNAKTLATEAIRMSNLFMYPSIVAKGALGQLFTRGAIARFMQEEERGKTAHAADVALEYFGP